MHGCIFNTKKKYAWNKAWLKNLSPKKVQPLVVKWLVESQKKKYEKKKIIKSKMIYSDSESEFKVAINSVSDFESASESGSESRHLYFLYPILAFF